MWAIRQLRKVLSPVVAVFAMVGEVVVIVLWISLLLGGKPMEEQMAYGIALAVVMVLLAVVSALSACFQASERKQIEKEVTVLLKRLGADLEGADISVDTQGEVRVPCDSFPRIYLAVERIVKQQK